MTTKKTISIFVLKCCRWRRSTKRNFNRFRGVQWWLDVPLVWKCQLTQCVWIQENENLYTWDSPKTNVFCNLSWQKVYSPFFFAEWTDRNCLVGYAARMATSSATDGLSTKVTFATRWCSASLLTLCSQFS
jgi:hypothetical protein